MASQAIVLSQLMTPGTTMLLPNGRRAAGIWAIPDRGPIADRTPTRAAPIRLPTMIASTPDHHPRPTIDASVPTKNAAGTRFGVNQTVNRRPTEPYRADTGMGSIP